ncbi:N/A [soil metagenome]
MLALLLAAGLVLLLTIVLIDQIRRGLVARVAARAAAILRNQMHRQIYRLGQSALPTQGIGPVVDLFTREVNDVQAGLLAELDSHYRWPSLAAGLLILAILLSWQLSLFLLVLLILVVLVARIVTRRSEARLEANTRDAAVQLCLLQEDLGLLRTVRIFSIEGVDKRRFEDHLERYQQADRRRLRGENRLDPAVALLAGVAGVLAIGMVGFNILDFRLTMATALTMLGALVGLILSMAAWLRSRPQIRRAERSSGAIVEFLDRRPELLQKANARFLPPLREQITFENVTVEGPSGRPILEGASLRIQAGTRTAIMGRDEESKQALVCLIPRLIDPKVGRIRVDGIDLRDVTLESLRAQVATVLQTDLVFSDTVLANISLGDASFDLPRVIEAAKLAHAHHVIQDLPHGYDTFIGPLGHYLRSDEQYRIALARAFLHDPSIIIIEEPTTPIDDDTKHLIDDTVSRLAVNRTLIFIPRRLSTIRSCQQIVVLHNGRVEALGTARELQAESKIFRHLQYLEFNQFAAGGVEAGQMNG